MSSYCVDFILMTLCMQSCGRRKQNGEELESCPNFCLRFVLHPQLSMI